ncbi:MAG: ATP-binding cassette domain-containing protein [Pseudomonadota bacterium]|nr:ATP-binding cassette domain-containing protein [Pseudomonadota bacterium]
MVESIFPVEITDVTVRKRGRALLDGISLSLAPKGITIVMGPNGAGKSTLLKALHGMERLNGGHIQWSQPKSVTQKRQAFVFQTPILMRRPVIDNVAYPLTLRGVSRAEAREKARQWLERVKLGPAAHQRAAELSGGERQKMALARALIGEPELLFLDEPCANLDGRATREIEELLQSANAGGTRIIMATHDMGQARRLADDVVFLNKAKLLEHADAQAFFESPTTPQAQAFLKGEIVE